MHPENAGIWQLLMICKNQFRCSMAGIYGIDMTAVDKVAERIHEELDFEIDYLFYIKVKAFETEIVNHANAKYANQNGPCDEEKKKQCREIYGEYFEATCKKCEDMKNVRSGSKD